MKKLKVVLPFLFVMVSVFTLFGCNKTSPLEENVVEVRTNIYTSTCDNYSLKGAYGYKLNKDGDKIYTLTIKLLDKEIDNTTYSLSLLYKGQNYQQNFTLDPVKHALTVNFEIDNFTESTFEATLISSSVAEKVTFNSIIPPKTISYLTALDYFYRDQSTLIENRQENGQFTSKIVMRIVVKEDKPYWYIGVIDNDGSLKALLLDGFTGKTLAIREVF